MVKVLFGLESQGHIKTIEEKLKAWHPRLGDENSFQVWRDIAKEIGWIDYAVCQDYISYLKRKSAKIEALEQENERLRDALSEYADGSNWKYPYREGNFKSEWWQSLENGFDTARKALALHKEGE